MHNEAHEQGYAAGYAEGIADAQDVANRMQTMLDNLQQAVGEIDQRIADHRLATSIEIRQPGRPLCLSREARVAAAGCT